MSDSIPSLNNSEEPDQWSWNLEKNGWFSVESLFDALSPSMSSVDSTLMSSIWRRTPKKVNFFSWELAHNSVNIYAKIQRHAPWMCAYHTAAAPFATKDTKLLYTYLVTAPTWMLAGIFYLTRSDGRLLDRDTFHLSLPYSSMDILSKRRKKSYGNVLYMHYYGNFGWSEMIVSSQTKLEISALLSIPQLH